jgi:tRNA uridine 5-carboxymethylaminomethyl modification enzyme
MKERKTLIEAEISRVRAAVIKPSEAVNRYLRAKGCGPISEAAPLSRLLKRAEMDYGVVDALAKSAEPLPAGVARQVEIAVKYEGYIAKLLREIERFKDMERIHIPEGFDFAGVHGLSNELKEKLSGIRPLSLGQVSRVEGITPAALWAILITLKKKPGKECTRGTR